MSRNEDILTALRTEQRRRLALNQPSHFRFNRAIEVVMSHRGNIRRASDLSKYVGKGGGITKNVLSFIEDVLHGKKPVNSPQPTAKEIQRAQARRRPRAYIPGARTGAEAVLLTLYEHSLQGEITLTKSQILRDAQAKCDTDMYQPDASGYTAWKGVDTLTSKKLVTRYDHSRNARAFGGYGMRQDEFEITDAGKAVAQACLRRRGGGGLSNNRVAVAQACLRRHGGDSVNNRVTVSNTKVTSSNMRVTGINTKVTSSNMGVASSQQGHPNCKCHKPAKVGFAFKSGKRVRVWRCAKSSRYQPMGRCFFNYRCDEQVPTASARPSKSRKICPEGTCADCSALRAFMNSGESIREFKMGKERRLHLHHVCEGLGLTHVSQDYGTNRRKLIVTVPLTSSVGVSVGGFPSDRSVVAAVGWPSLHDQPVSRTIPLSPRHANKLSSFGSTHNSPKLDKATLRERRLIAIACQESLHTPSPPRQKILTAPKLPIRRGAPSPLRREIFAAPKRPIGRDTSPMLKKRRVTPSTLPSAPNDTTIELMSSSDEAEAPTASVGSATRRRIVMCVVDDYAERLKNKDPNRIFQRCSEGHDRIKGLPVCVGRLHLALGDYAWVMVKNSEDDPSTGLTLPVCIERKTISDLVARSAKRDHLKQLRRLSNLDLTSFLLLECDPAAASAHTAWGASVEINDEDAGTIRGREHVHMLHIDIILGSHPGVKVLETTSFQGTSRLLCAMSTLLASGVRKPQSQTMKSFSMETRSMTKKLSAMMPEPDPLDRAQLQRDVASMTSSSAGLTSTTGFVQVGAAELTGEGVFACVGREASCLFAVIPGETWVKVLMSNLTELGVKTGGLDEEGVVNAARCAATMLRSHFDVTMPSKGGHEKVLIIEGLYKAVARLRRASARGDEIDGHTVLNSGIHEALIVAELHLVLSEHNLHVKKTKNSEETMCFLSVLKQRCGVELDPLHVLSEHRPVSAVSSGTVSSSATSVSAVSAGAVSINAASSSAVSVSAVSSCFKINNRSTRASDDVNNMHVSLDTHPHLSKQDLIFGDDGGGDAGRHVDVNFAHDEEPSQQSVIDLLTESESQNSIIIMDDESQPLSDGEC